MNADSNAEGLPEPASVRQVSPGPISLELFGLEESEDAPLELPLQAAITVLPPAASTPHLPSHHGLATPDQAEGVPSACYCLFN